MKDRSQHLTAAVHSAVRKLSASTSVQETLKEVLELCVEAVDAEAGTIYMHDPANRKLEFRHVLPETHATKLPKDIADDFGIAGSVFHSCSPKVTTTEGDSERLSIEQATETPVRNMLTVPLCVPGGEAIGVVQLINKRSGAFDDEDLAVLESVGAVCAMAISNSVLVEQVGRTASLMGMGNVSHDIANLAGVLRSHLYMTEPLVAQLLSARDDPTVRELSMAIEDLDTGTTRIERYSRLLADIAAGRPARLAPAPGSLPKAVREAAAYLEPLARKERCELHCDVCDHADETLFDGLAVQRIVDNLVTNAIKAVKEGSEPKRVTLRLRPSGDDFILEVIDTGPGMTDFAAKRILQGTAVSAWTASTGTGLGTKVVRELVAAHGGRMEIESEVGTGTTFRVFIPSERMAASTETPA
jgi:K+-sensing histidine kinase KdpD